MRVDVLTLFPELVETVGRHGVTGRACEAGLLELVCWNPRDYTLDRHRTVDDRPYGGGPGMVMKYQPLADAIDAARAASPEPVRVAYLSPQGRRLDQAACEELAGRARLLLVCGRYEGVDERLIESRVDEEWSIGDYVLSGGELGAMVMIDAVSRLLPGVLGHDQSAAQDSFTDGLLDCPHYTRPEQVLERSVPQVLLSGDHQAIARWRRQQQLGRTWQRRPELIRRETLTDSDRRLLDEFITERRAREGPGEREG
ncbi:tRNA (guanosine(37)-N1)-methyltransferase TrmD [Alkalilimnicola sp. S0819]|uniref:tRNA (guanosine(37)-N1)-methyltransferase TrmD n=1 Tax=Alkalilimnicola sp. S0819 TaxID=2613922 RepID=UPI00126172A1|nr:tRNA (guanosine(37)-N1)-methyltransferase TrmD [Alkalilimnicola sp. S0819]KAB7622564.1 tRNA (guanosine(37)-N1)-methyltransferase TrmD [Alkalilimnicola sp. S0819]MPQ17451.1 tRNA (guanosine(37)-N1)-methyltransferase TrmD [Alkalilimnicola sp. S0819]